MTSVEPTTRYFEYLRRFGITAAASRVAELRDLDIGGVRFFAYAGEAGLRLKAAVTPQGWVRAGRHPDDDWHGFLSAMPDATAAAERIAWLETDEATPAHQLPTLPISVILPTRPPAAGVDPAQWALVTPPTRAAGPRGSVTWAAWLLMAPNTPTRWTIAAQPATAASIECVSALDLLVARAGSAARAASEAAERARKLLLRGADPDRSWALQHLGDVGDRSAVHDIAALLGDARVSPELRRSAAGALARIADPGGTAALGAALRSDPAAEVRRASAQALGTIGGTDALQVLTEAATLEQDTSVRVEIVHALITQGSAARDALSKVAGSDPDASIRALARGGLAAY